MTACSVAFSKCLFAAHKNRASLHFDLHPANLPRQLINSHSIFGDSSVFSTCQLENKESHFFNNSSKGEVRGWEGPRPPFLFQRWSAFLERRGTVVGTLGQETELQQVFKDRERHRPGQGPGLRCRESQGRQPESLQKPRPSPGQPMCRGEGCRRVNTCPPAPEPPRSSKPGLAAFSLCHRPAVPQGWSKGSPGTSAVERPSWGPSGQLGCGWQAQREGPRLRAGRRGPACAQEVAQEGWRAEARARALGCVLERRWEGAVSQRLSSGDNWKLVTCMGPSKSRQPGAVARACGQWGGTSRPAVTLA